MSEYRITSKNQKTGEIKKFLLYIGDDDWHSVFTQENGKVLVKVQDDTLEKLEKIEKHKLLPRWLFIVGYVIGILVWINIIEYMKIFGFFGFLFGLILLLWPVVVLFFEWGYYWSELSNEQIKALIKTSRPEPYMKDSVANNSSQTETIKPKEYTLEEKITNQLQKLENEINDEIDKKNLKLNTKERVDLKQNLAKIRLKENLNWMKEGGTSKEFIEDIAEKFEVQEQKKLSNHYAFEGRIKSSDKAKMKNLLGYDCMACGINMGDKFGDIGKGYIELHHKIPYADMKENDERVLGFSDFFVLCPNCHCMIHKLDNPADIEVLRNIIALHKIT